MTHSKNCSVCNNSSDGEIGIKEIAIATSLFICGIVIEHFKLFSSIQLPFENAKSFDLFLSLILFLISYLIVGKDVVIDAVKNLFNGKVFDEKFLMSVATIGAVAIGDYPEAVGVMLLYQIGEYAQDKAVGKSKDAIKALMEIKPDKAFVRRDSKIIEVSPDDVLVGEIIVVKPGERIALDGIVVNGKSFLDTSALTGESVPRQVLVGSEVSSGTINTGSVIEIKTTKLAGQSAASRIIELVENAQEKKAHSEKFITRFSRIYTPIVCVLALLLAIIPSIITNDFQTWIYRSLIFLVVSCPCALVISVPLSFFCGIGTASKNGILIKGSESIETLSKAQIAVFDKTGTLTKGVFVVSEVHTSGKVNIDKDELIAIAAHAETYSNHPISKSLKASHSGECCSLVKISDAEEISGQGIKVKLDGKQILAGNIKLMKSNNITDIDECYKTDFGTIIHVAIDGVYAGHIVISDQTKQDSKSAIQKLHKLGIKKVVMLTGDNKERAVDIAKELGIDEVYAELLPEDKVNKIELLLSRLKTKQGKKDKSLFFAGDGINDSPVLARSDVGIAMGALGSDAAIESADIVIMTDEITKIADAISISIRTKSIVKQNIAFALIVKFAIMILGSFGIANMWTAVFGDTGTALLAVANAMRIMLWKKND